jgi:hypothetical protein
MRMALMQPYFFPYIGYFSLIAQVDTFVSYRSASFSKNGWQNRNRIRGPKDEWTHFGLRVKRPSLGTPIRDVQLFGLEEDATRLLSKLDIYKQESNFENVREMIRSVLAVETTSLAEINELALTTVAERLNLATKFASTEGIDFSGYSSPEEKVIAVCKRFGADTYVNLPGGRSLYDKDHFSAAGLRLQFLEGSEASAHEALPMGPLSIIDDLMTRSTAELNTRLFEFGALD